MILRGIGLWFCIALVLVVMAALGLSVVGGLAFLVL